MFVKYQHVEKLGAAETNGIRLGECYIFPKIDGTNGCIWYDPENGGLQFGSRKRHLTDGQDNQGFKEMMRQQEERLLAFFERKEWDAGTVIRLYGEWLVSHTFKHYRDGAWRQFYIFDVTANKPDGTLHHCAYDYYQPILEEFGLEYIPPLAVIENPSMDQLLQCLEKNDYLVKDGAGVGEGIVIKNYNFVNRYGRTIWAKIVRSEFKEKHTKEMGPVRIASAKTSEGELIKECCTEHLIKKTFEKMKNDEEGWRSKRIFELFGRIYHDILTEELPDFIKRHKNPAINFKDAFQLVIRETKATMPEIF